VNYPLWVVAIGWDFLTITISIILITAVVLVDIIANIITQHNRIKIEQGIDHG